MSSEGSESETDQPSTPKKKLIKKMPKNKPEDQLKKKEESHKENARKLSTKDMINQALVDLKSRKGTSLYAIKKYIEEKYKVDIDKLNYIIKKSIKSGVETGVIVQTKGVGASGSFKLAPGKVKPEKETKKKEPKKSLEKSTKPSKPKSIKPKKIKESKSNENKNEAEKPKKKEVSNSTTSEGKNEKVKKGDEKIAKGDTKTKKISKTAKIAKGSQTPAKKKAAMMKRKSIGSIIKPPKMNPKKG